MNDWSWKPDKQDNADVWLSTKTINNNKKSKKKGKNKQKPNFYKSREWLELRYRVIRKYKGNCMACGQNHMMHGAVIHVDHIKCRLKFPKLELVFSNLQILCEKCNKGKSYKYKDDWRPMSSTDLAIAKEMNKFI